VNRRRPPARDDGTAVGLAGVGLAMAGMLTVVAIDAGAYLLAASRAQAVADAAALAAAIAIDDGRPASAAARKVAAAADAEVVGCDCTTLPVEVKVGVQVIGLVIPTLGPRRVVATSHATMLEP